MKTTLLIVLMSAMFAAAQASTHRLASYNIRFTGSADDTGGKLWDNRGPVCRDVILNYDFDIVGFQEACGTGRAHRNANTGRTQLEDLRAWLPDYELIAWDRDGTPKREYVATAYKKSRYDLVDQGYFFIGPTPDVFSYGWDTVIEAHPRVLGWLRLRDKESGQEFIYACTHTNDGWSLDGPYGSQLIVKKLAEIAGDLPVMCVADYNSNRAATHSQKGLQAYRAAFHDAALTVPQGKNYSLPVTNRACTWTYNAFHPVSDTSYSGSEIDFQFYRGMNILERHIVTEEYTYNGQQFPSSDHFPLYVVAELAPVAKKTLYVDCNAAEGGNGTVQAPFKTINAALEAADIDDTVCVAAGTYAESVQPRYSGTIVGGYDPSFSSAEGMTVIEGESLAMPPVYVPGYMSLTLKNFEVRNYTSTDVRYDGAIHFQGADLVLENVVASGNTAVDCGGGLAVYDSANSKYCASNNVSLTNCKFTGNYANYGAGMTVGVYSSLTVDGCTFADNTAAMSGGGAYLVFGQPESSKIWFTEAKAIIKNSAFVGNKAARQGALYVNDEMPNVSVTTVNTTFSGNTLTAKSGLPTVVKGYGGTAIFAKLTDRPTTCTLSKVKNGRLNMGHITVIGNHATCSAPANFLASAINVDGGEAMLLNSVVAANTTNGTNAKDDFTIADPARLTKETYNIFTAPQTVSISTDAKTRLGADQAAGTAHISDMFAGEVDADGKYVPVHNTSAATTHFVPVDKTVFNTDDVATITILQRNLERDFGVDVDGDGSVGTQLKTDQLGLARNSKSMPGAVDYHPELTSSGICMPEHSHGSVTVDSLAGGRFQVSATVPLGCVKAFDEAGCAVASTVTTNTDCVVDLSPAKKGVYIISCLGNSFKVLN